MFLHRIGISLALLLVFGSQANAQMPEGQLAAPQVLPINDPRLRLIGRADDRDPAHPHLAYPATGVEFRFKGTGAMLEVIADTPNSALTIVIDQKAPTLAILKPGTNTVTLGENLDDFAHTAEIYKRTESWQGTVTLIGLTLSPGATLLDLPPLPQRKLMFVGDSVTCGVGIDNNATCTKDAQLPDINAYESYGMLLGRRLDAETQLVCYGGRGLVRDYRGLTIADNVVNIPDFFTLAIPSDKPEGRVPWDANRFQPDAIFMSIGTNDMNLEKDKPLDETAWVSRYVDFLHKSRSLYPRALIFITEGSIVTDPLLARMVQRAAAQSLDSRVLYAPSQHYPGLPCNGHPTGIQHRHMADDFEPVLRRALSW